MKEFWSKNKVVVTVVSELTALAAVAVSYVAYLIRSDRRDIERTKKWNDFCQTQIDCLRNMKKES